MEESILNSTKKILGIGDGDLSFDLDIITHINSAFSHLQQLGVGPEAGFQITDATPKWADFLPAPADPAPPTYLPILNAVKVNVYLHVRYVFDPPQLQHLMGAIERQMQESDWRLNALRESADWIDPLPIPTASDELQELINIVDSQVIG